MKNKENNSKVIIWNSVFDSWTKCVEKAKGEDGVKGFSNSEWLNRIKLQLDEFRLEFKSFKIAIPPRPCTLPRLVTFSQPKCIIDLGGSSGWVYEYLKILQLDKNLSKYNILEVESIVKYSRKFKHSNKVEYTSDIQNINSCDILYSNSVIQYFANDDYLIDIIKKSSPTFLLFDDLYAGEQKEFFSHQINYDRLIPHRFLNFKKFTKNLKTLGYELISREPYHTPIRGVYQPKPMDNFDPKLRLRYSLSALFKKIP